MCTDDSPKLLNCPFCGGEAVFDAHATAEGIGNGMVCRTLAVIECPRCEFCISWETDYEAVKRWNARAAVTDEQFAVAVHDGRAWQVVRMCGEYRGGVYETPDGTSDDIELWCEHCDIPLEDGWRNCPNCGAKVVGR